MQKLDNKEQKCVHDLDELFLFSSHEYFCRSIQQKIVEKIFFFVIKPKCKLFWRIADTLSRHWEKLYEKKKKKSRTNLISFKTVGALKSLEGIAKLNTIRSNLDDKYSIILLWKMCRDNIWSLNFDEIISFI